jgi:transposase
MTHDDLRAERERLKQQVAKLLGQKSTAESDNAELHELLEKLQALTQVYDEKLTEAEAQIADLKRELFGPKADRLTPEQQEQLSKLNEDLQSEAQRQGAASEGVLEEEEEKKKHRRAVRRVRHPLPEHLETETVTIQPEVAPCPRCGNIPERIGEEVTDEIDYIPARLIRRRIVRPKHACRCGEAGANRCHRCRRG